MIFKLIIKNILLSILIFNTVNSFPQYTITKSIDDEEPLFPLSIIHVNDFHARFEEVDPFGGPCKPNQECIGGYARVVSKIKELQKFHEDRKENPIYLDAGDNFQGTLWYNIGRWNVTKEFLNYLPADAITIGNHEFDNGIEGLVPFLENLAAPVVIANVDDHLEPTMQKLYKKSIVIEKGGRKIGIIGVILQSTDELSNTGKLKFLNESISVLNEAERLTTNEGVNIIIVVSHCGYDVDQIIAEKAGPNIDIIIGAHSHTFLYPSNTELPGPDKPKGPYPTIIKQKNNHEVLVVQASAYSKYVGDITLYFDKNGKIKEYKGKPHYVKSDIKKDEFIEERLKPWKEIVDSKGNELIGYSAVELSKNDCGVRECNLGNMFTDALVEAALELPVTDSKYWTNASIGMANQGSLRIPLSKGNLTFNHLVQLSPFENELEVFSLKGKYLLQALEHSVSSDKKLSPLTYTADNNEDNFNFRNMLQVSGLKIVYDLKKEDGERVKSVLVRCWKCEIPMYEELKDDETYRIVTTSFVGSGGDGYHMIAENKFDWSQWLTEVEAITNYVRRNSPIITGREGRMQFV